MNQDLWKRAAEVFGEAVMLPKDEVGAFLNEHCADDAELRAEVESMLRDDAAATDAGFLTPVISPPTSAFSPTGVARDERDAPDAQPTDDSMIGREVGVYRIESLIDRGGMGSVYLGVRKADYQTKVAIKLIRRGMDSESVVNRFKNELQLQAALGEHPNIAGIVDAGQTEEGLPFFVMQFVDGIRIDEYCDNHRLSNHERLELFATVCSTVQFAHQNTIIHRDLKPSNILVSRDGRPILIDFGIAKALEDEQHQFQSNLTHTDAGVFTPWYASPEQVQSLPLTTATDVYSLGVVLYELLVGHKPYRIESGSVSEMVHAIVSQTPILPSRAVGETAAIRETSTGGVSSCRRTTPRRLQQQLSGELDHILLMSLRKDPARRYQTVSALESDIRNYLTGHPVSARPDSFVYRASKFVQRNKVPVSIAVMLVISLIAGIVGTTGGLLRANREWQRAEDNAILASKQQEQATAQKLYAEEQERIAKLNEKEARETVNNFYLTVSREQLFETPSLQPLRLSFLESAMEYYETAHRRQPNDPSVSFDYANVLFHVGATRSMLGNVQEADRAMARARELLEQGAQSDDEDIAKACRGSLGRVYMFLATSIVQSGKPMDAISWYEKSEKYLLEATANFPNEVSPKEYLAELYSAVGFHWGTSPKPDKATDYLAKAQKLREEILESNPDDSSHKYHLARTYWDTGYNIREIAVRESGEARAKGLKEAMDHYDRSVAILKPLVRQHPGSYAYQMVLGEVYASIGFVYFYENKRDDISAAQKDENSRLALRAFENSLQIRKRLAEQNPNVQRMLHSLAKGYTQVGMEQRILGDMNAAMRSHEMAVATWRELIAKHPSDLRVIHGLASALASLGLAFMDSGDSPAAEETLREATKLQRITVKRAPGFHRYQTALANQLLNLSLACRDRGKFEEAAALIAEAKQESPGGPDQLLTIARFQALLIGRMIKIQDSESQLEVTSYQEAAIQYVRDALASGKLAPRDFRSDDFAPLREDARFTELLSAQ